MTIDVEVEDGAWAEALPEAAALAARAARAAWAAARAEGEPVLAILLTGDDAVRGLNARFRGRDQPTNVLSFPAGPNPEGHLGDIALAFGACAREAAEQGKSLGDHLSHLATHGVLHLLGYDHETDEDAEVMEALERQILAPLGVPDPYAAESPPS